MRDPILVGNAVRGTDCVVHLAAVNGTEYFYSKPHVVLDVGIVGMLNVIAACRQHGVSDLVVASSSEVYQLPPEIPTDETAPLTIPDPLNARYSYAGSKIASELLAINYGRHDFKCVTIFRPHNVYGPDMAWGNTSYRSFVCARSTCCRSIRAELSRFSCRATAARRGLSCTSTTWSTD